MRCDQEATMEFVSWRPSFSMARCFGSKQKVERKPPPLPLLSQTTSYFFNIFWLALPFLFGV